MSFPDVDPSFISIPHERQGHYKNPALQRLVIKEITESFDQPHLWYSTADVVHALKLFIASGDELSQSNTYRLVSTFYVWKISKH